MVEYVFPSIQTPTVNDFGIFQRVRLASTANVSTAGNLAATVIDGVTPVAGDLVLLKNQTTTTQNGIYTVVAGAGASTLSVIPLSAVNIIVVEGTNNATTCWFCTNLPGADVAGVNSLAFSQTIGSNLNGDATTSTAQVFTNKQLSSTNILGKGLRNTTGTVLLSLTDPYPTTGQILVANSPTEITWQTVTAVSGETNTASNVGVADPNLQSVFKIKSGVNLQFNNLAVNANNKLSISLASNLITLDVVPTNLDLNLFSGTLLADKGGTGLSNPAANNVFVNDLSGTLYTLSPNPTGAFVDTTSPQTLTNKSFANSATVGQQVRRAQRVRVAGGGEVNCTTAPACTIGLYFGAITSTTGGFIATPGSYSIVSVAEANSTSVSTTFATRATLTITNPRPAGIYRVVFYWEMQVTGTVTNAIQAKVVRGTKEHVYSMVLNNTVTGDYVPFGCIMVDTLVSTGVITYLVQHRTTNAATTSNIQRVRANAFLMVPS